MRTFHEKLTLEFPETPESFKKCVTYAVEAQLAARTKSLPAAYQTRSHKMLSRSKWMLPVAACLMLICGTAAASSLPAFQQWLSSLGSNEKQASELIIHKENESDTSDALFTVTDAYFDGATLMFWAVPGEDIPALDFADHVFINDTDNRLEYIVETEPGSGIYECKVTILDENLKKTPQSMLDIKVDVYVPEGAKQEFSFRIQSDKLRSAAVVEDQTFVFSYGQAKVSDLSVSPSSTRFYLHWQISDEKMLDILYIPNYFVEDANGNRKLLSEIMTSSGVSEKTYNEAAQCWEYVQEFDIRKFDIDSEYMLLIPYEEGHDENGRTEVPREDMSFRVLLK